jgi:putative membrane protein insertion efficiency factor
MTKYIIIILVLLFASPTDGAERLSLEDPWDFNVSSTSRTNFPLNHGTISWSSRILLLGIKGFREYISAVDGDRCHMVPTCSTYSLQAVEKHGFLYGVLMTTDRLIHENDEMELAPVVTIEGENRFYDPVSANDFWWNHLERLDK